MDMYDVYFYKQKNGESPVTNFIASCQKSLRSKIARQITTLREFGLTVENPYLRKLTGTPLWESRILGRDNTRIISMAFVKRKIVILNIFRKKSQKTPTRDIEISMKRYRDLTNDI